MRVCIYIKLRHIDTKVNKIAMHDTASKKVCIFINDNTIKICQVLN